MFNKSGLLPEAFDLTLGLKVYIGLMQGLVRGLKLGAQPDNPALIASEQRGEERLLTEMHQEDRCKQVGAGKHGEFSGSIW